ncbi:LmeA family phospholipid-binding protein [Streptomyces sp. NPDC054855]
MFSPRIRRRRATITVVAVISGTALAATSLDLAVAEGAEREIATAFRQATGAQEEPHVRVEGFPVLAQVAAGSFDHVDVSARGIPADTGRALPITRLDAQMEGLTAPGEAQGARSRRATATAFLSYADLSDALGLEVRSAGRAGRVGAHIQTPLGESVNMTAAVKAGPDNTIMFEGPQIAGTQVPDVARKLLTGIFERPIPLRNVPRGLSLTALHAGADGLKGHFDGQDVSFQPGSGTA